MSTPSETLDHLVTRASELYSLPAVAMQVLELTRDPRVDAGKLKQCIENDPALTTRLLKVVNSSLYGLSQEVRDLNQALALLGVKPLKLLVLGFSLPTGLFADVARKTLARYWTQTLTQAVAARELARVVWKVEGDEAFLAALLCDLGHLVLVKELGTPYVRLVERVYLEEGNLPLLEQQTLGFTHPQLTASLLRFWGLPDALVEAVQSPDCLARCQSPAQRHVCEIVHVAKLLALFLTRGGEGALEEILAVGGAYRELNTQQLAVVVEAVQGKVEQLSTALLQQPLTDLNYRDVLERARQQMAVVSQDVSVELLEARHEVVAARSASLLLSDEVRQLKEVVAEYDPTRQARVAVTVERGQDLLQGAAFQGAGFQGAGESAAGAGSSTTRSTRRPATPPASSPTLSEGDDDPALHSRLWAAVVACRQSRRPLSLMLIEVDHHADLAFHHGVAGAELLVEQVRQLASEVDHVRAASLVVREARFALVLPDCERQEAVRLGNHLQSRVRELTLADLRLDEPPVTVSIGVATVGLVPKNFAPERMSEAASRCLYGAQASGGNSLKSIEIY